jgi:hypothetical protein
MADTRQVPNEVLYDKRLIDRHVKAGMISRKEVEAQRQSAADLADQAAAVEVDAGSHSS